MPELQHPVWLLGLALVPLVRWLHRLRPTPPPAMVSALFLWPPREASPGDARRRLPPDPAWRRRAFIVALVVLGAAAPAIPTISHPVIDVWFDDSLSMHTVEGSDSRIDLGFSRLEQALAEASPRLVRIHSLTNPGPPLVLQPDDRSRWQAMFKQWLGPPGGRIDAPPQALMTRNTLHWLVSDGADPAVRAWLKHVPITRTFQVGTVRRNAAVTGLALRPSQSSTGEIQGLVTVRNAGSRPLRRLLRIHLNGAGDAIPPVRLVLAPGDTTRIPFVLHSTPAGPVTAELSPQDALSEDDSLTVEPSSALRLPVSVTGTCPRPVTAAIDALPTVYVTAPVRPVRLRIRCGGKPAAGTAPILWLRRPQRPVPVHGVPVWSPAAGPLRDLNLDRSWLRTDGSWTDYRGERVMLSAGGIPLVLSGDDAPQTVEVRLDLAAPGLARRPEYPLLVAGLIEMAAGTTVLDAIARSTRPGNASRVTPFPLRASASAPASRGRPGTTALSGYLVLAALIGLVVDLLKTPLVPAPRQEAGP